MDAAAIQTAIACPRSAVAAPRPAGRSATKVPAGPRAATARRPPPRFPAGCRAARPAPPGGTAGSHRRPARTAAPVFELPTSTERRCHINRRHGQTNPQPLQLELHQIEQTLRVGRRLKQTDRQWKIGDCPNCRAGDCPNCRLSENGTVPFACCLLISRNGNRAAGRRGRSGPTWPPHGRSTTQAPHR